MDRILQLTGRVVGARAFEYAIIALILVSGVLLGLGTSPSIVERYGDALTLGNQLILAVFIVEAALKMTALAPRPQRYFRDGWNVFDFAIIVFALVPATGSLAMVARLGRLLRVLRLISAIKELRLIVGALVRSIPSVANIMMLMSIIVYIYAIVGYHLFSETDPTHWRTLGRSVLTLFEIITLEGWTEVMRAAMEHHPLRVALFRQLRGGRHVRRGKPLHRRRHQQPRQRKGGAVANAPGPGVPGRAPPRAPYNPGDAPPPGESVDRLRAGRRPSAVESGRSSASRASSVIAVHAGIPPRQLARGLDKSPLNPDIILRSFCPALPNVRIRCCNLGMAKECAVMEILTIAEVTEDPLVAIGSAIDGDGLRGRICEHIDNPGRAERAILACRCGWNHLAVQWAETPDPRSALDYEAALLRAYFAQHLRMPSITGLPAQDMVGTVRPEAAMAFLVWSGLHALNDSNKHNFPTDYGVYVISAGRPEDPEIWDPPQGTMPSGACGFARKGSLCILNESADSLRDRPPRSKSADSLRDRPPRLRIWPEPELPEGSDEWLQRRRDALYPDWRQMRLPLEDYWDSSADQDTQTMDEG